MKSGIVLLRVQFFKNPASRRPDSNAVDVVDVKVRRSSSERIAINKPTLNNGSDSLQAISVDDSRHRFV
jgi:hypothetical protein